MKLLLGTLCLSFFVIGTSATREEDLVESLPGLDPPEPTFDHYAGYLDATDGKKLFYWYDNDRSFCADYIESSHDVVENSTESSFCTNNI